MSDIAGTAAGLISLGIQVIHSLVEFYNSYKSQDSSLASMADRLGSLSDIFQCLEKTLSDRSGQKEEQSLIRSIEISMKKCDGLIYELQEECQKFHKTSNAIGAAVRVAGRRATYPFRQSTLQKLDEDIGEIRDNLSSALDVLQLKDNRRVQDGIAEVKVLLELIRTHQISSDLRGWLEAPDATADHNAACAKKCSGTGIWLVQSPVFLKWLTEQNSILWLNGFAGSGKSVLCSTAIQFALRHRGSDPSVGIAFFYFTFHEKSKQDESGMLRALLLQLSGQLPNGEADLARLHQSNKAGIPGSCVLMEHLRYLIQRFRHVYIALDGLDESPRGRRRAKVLDTLNDMRNWGIQGLHLFITSRDEPDIHESLDLFPHQQVKMWNVGIDRDIASFVSVQLDTDRRLRKWLPYRDKIQETLTKRAEGVFRWVECQFETLQSCPRSEDHLDHLLNSLPQSLDETYERMLCNIDPYLVKDARRILTLLCFAARPLTVQELIDGVAVKISDPPGLSYQRRLQDFNDLHTICPGFIALSFDDETESYDQENSGPTVQIAHFSVQEYLESERIRHQKAEIFSLDSVTAHTEIAQICLVYLLEHGLSSAKWELSILEKHPLAYFAARYWNRHYQNAIKPTTGLDGLILRLFQDQNSFFTWITLYDVDPDGFIDFHSELDDVGAPVYYASLLGLDHTLNELIKTASGEDTTTSALSLTSTSKIIRLVNAQRGRYANALQAASNQGHKIVVQLLLDKGADINAHGGRYGNALQAASDGGHERVVQLLLDKGADINAQGRHYNSALQAASDGGHERVVQLLLNKGADVNAQGRFHGNALQAASVLGHKRIVELLLDKGADINAQDGLVGNALQAASFWGHKRIVELLLDKGAAVNAQGGRYGNALQAASRTGHERLAELLLDRGADVNAQGGRYGNALQAASRTGHERLVELLLDRGADVNAQGGRYGNALQAASLTVHERLVKLLLDRGADVNAQGGPHGNALRVASLKGHERVVQLLLDKGADVNAQGGKLGNALEAASYGGHRKVMKLLLERGADSTTISTRPRRPRPPRLDAV